MIRAFAGQQPRVAPDAFVADSALVLGDVDLAEESSVWYGCVVRGDVNSIQIGRATNIQDRVVVHVTSEQYPTSIGDGVTVGHGAVLHGCRVGDQVLVGIAAVLLDGTEIGAGSIVAAGSLVPPGKTYPSGVLIMGNPARVIRQVSPTEREWIASSADHYVDLARQHRQSST